MTQFGKEKKMKLSVGIYAMLWSIWNCRNDICFERIRAIIRFVMIPKTCYLINSWSILQKKHESQGELTWG